MLFSGIIQCLTSSRKDRGVSSLSHGGILFVIPNIIDVQPSCLVQAGNPVIPFFFVLHSNQKNSQVDFGARTCIKVQFKCIIKVMLTVSNCVLEMSNSTWKAVRSWRQVVFKKIILPQNQSTRRPFTTCKMVFVTDVRHESISQFDRARRLRRIIRHGCLLRCLRAQSCKTLNRTQRTGRQGSRCNKVSSALRPGIGTLNWF
mmetsp:Transcript_22341/g.55364  ORF Transcript_22341/g.55364 Transcript_22341/m.55364 type:complete len:202 (+) Transcript_22341:1013-1618(+)